VRDLGQLGEKLALFKPDAVFHLAAQAVVPRGYERPKLTWDTNATGTINVLEALREIGRPCAAVIVTTDKVYGGGEFPHIETDRLLGTCPYSASKVAAELAVEAYRTSFFAGRDHRIAVATARAGNVIGGGDFGYGRLVPNAIRALVTGNPIPVYHVLAVRPWQYVEDVIEGYILLGAKLMDVSAGRVTDPDRWCSAWNFGPEQHHTVQGVVVNLIDAWGSGEPAFVSTTLHEVQELRIDSLKARTLLGWQQRWSFVEGIKAAVAWYRRHTGA
jgi:CDP-glucose 4,6-dehydratase